MDDLMQNYKRRQRKEKKNVNCVGLRSQSNKHFHVRSLRRYRTVKSGGQIFMAGTRVSVSKSEYAVGVV